MTQHFGDLNFIPIPVAGSTAGAHTATGVVAATDILRYVLNLTDSTDVTSEFSISDDNEITNTTTDLTGKLLLIFIERRDARGYTGSERLPSSE